jgi:phosphatidylinositol alpha-mannosyltransferase
MKIALISPYDFAYPGGVANHITNLYRNLTMLGHDVRVIAPASGSITTFGDNFIPIGRPRPFPANGSITRITVSPLVGSNVKKVLEAEHFDIVHLHEPAMPMLCTSALRLSRTTTVATFHACGNFPGYYPAKPFGTMLLRKWFNRLDARIAVSGAAMKMANRHFEGEYEIIPNGVDTHHFKPDVKPIEKYCDGKKNILFVGRLEKRKGAGYLLKAYARLKKEMPDTRLIIVGPGTMLRRQYERIVSRQHLADVEFVGFVGYDDLPCYYKTADVFCAPATGRESFGIVLLEAMATGTPIIASNIEGYAGVVTNGSDGLLVPPKDDKELAKALFSLLKDKQARRNMGARGVAKAKQYDWELVTQKLVNCYVRAMNGNAADAERVDATPSSV